MKNIKILISIKIINNSIWIYIADDKLLLDILFLNISKN